MVWMYIQKFCALRVYKHMQNVIVSVMAPYRNKRSTSLFAPQKKTVSGRMGVKRARTAKRVNLKSIVRQELNRNIESKIVVGRGLDGSEILHNNFVTLDGQVLFTGQGVSDSNATTSNRIGDEIMLKSVRFCMMLELNERYSDVTFRILLVKCARGDAPTRSTLFNGLSGNKMLDDINYERYSILYQKWVKMKAGNTGVDNGEPILSAVPPGAAGVQFIEDAADFNRQTYSRQTRIVKFKVPGHKFGNKGKIVYDAGGGQCKFFDYQLVVYAYANLSSAQDVFNVGRVNSYFRVFNFKDA